MSLFDDTKDTYSYKGWLISDEFLKRSLAVCGYYFVGGMLIWVGAMAVALLIGFILGFMGV